MTDFESEPEYARLVGGRLRNIRRQQGLSLQAVEKMSHREFKASVLGAYERGERIISVLRLQRLAELYGVPVDQLLPKLSGQEDSSSGSSPADDAPVVLDLTRLDGLDAPEKDVLQRYISGLQVERGDFNGRVITIREEDVRSLGRMFGRGTSEMRKRLTEMGVRIGTKPRGEEGEVRDRSVGA